MDEDDEDPEEDLANYPTDRDDDDEEEKEKSSRDNADDEEEDKDEDEEEQLAPADSIPLPACRTTAMISIRDQTPTPFLHAAEIPSPPLPVSSPLLVSPPPLPASPTYPLGYRVAMIRLRAESPSTSHPLPLPSPIVLPHTRASVHLMATDERPCVRGRGLLGLHDIGDGDGLRTCREGDTKLLRDKMSQDKSGID
ncbi:hypothetical protein Tco_1071756 [Tanacetum coccineum]